MAADQGAATDGEGMPTEREWLEGLPEDDFAGNVGCVCAALPRSSCPEHRNDSGTTTFYTSGGTRRHAIKEQDATAVWSFCGLVALVEQATFSTVEVNCARCIRWMGGDDGEA